MKNYLNETIFTECIRNVLVEKGIIVIDVKPILDYNVEPKFKVGCIGGTYFAKYSSYNRFSKEFFEMKGLECLNESICLLTFVSKNLPDINKQLNLYVWLDGENLRSFLHNKTEISCYEYGIKSSKLLKKLHEVNVSNVVARFNVDYYITDILAILRSNDCILKYKNLWLDLIVENADILKIKKKDSIIHFDFKPKNIMVSNDKLLLIDFDSFSIGNPWFDFYDKGLVIYKERQAFNKGVIDGYFNNNIPNDFWMFLKIISICTMIQMSAWSINKMKQDYIFSIEKHLLKSYSDDSNNIPKWYESL